MLKIDAFELAEEYLNSIHVSTSVVKATLMPSRYIAKVYCSFQHEHNLLLENKKGSRSHESHFFVEKDYAEGALFSVADYKRARGGKRIDKKAMLKLFEANVAESLRRRKRRIKGNPELDPGAVVKGSYTKPSDNILMGEISMWMTRHNNEGQAKMHQYKADDTVIWDFRLGVLKNDCVLLFKEKDSQDRSESDNKTDHQNEEKSVKEDQTGCIILAVSVPREFVEKFIRRHKCGELKSEKEELKDDKESRAKREEEEQEEEEREDEAYVHKATKARGKTVPSGPQPPVPSRPSKSGRRFYVADPDIGQGVLEAAGFECENDPTHETFESKRTGKPYMEPHHLIPISYSWYFSSGLDIPENIICLCPNCHKQFHYGTDAEKKRLLKHYLGLRSAGLKSRGLIIDLPTLCSFYKC